jgi:ATP-dependent RNA helicase DHX8/PRP22
MNLISHVSNVPSAEAPVIVVLGRVRHSRPLLSIHDMSDADITNLEFLSLVAKITQELVNHTGINDKTLAEFIIALHDESKSLPDFKAKLSDMGANFPESFIENMDRLILNMHPKHKKKSTVVLEDSSNAEVASELDKKKRMFPGLALKNQEWEPSATKDVIMKEVDDMMSQFEGAAKKTRVRPNENDERSPKRIRRSPERSPRRRSASPPRVRDWGDRRGRENNRRGPVVDDRPVLFKIYNGRVSGMKDFGAFVQLEGVAGRVEGNY